jgi:hypothetical protein
MSLKSLGLNVFGLSIMGAGVLCCLPVAHAQLSIHIGAEPACPYGYYDYAPYNCAPYGFYGQDWFNGGAFIGAGPWFRGRSDFYGHVDRRYDPHYGYRGPFPERGDRRFDHFHGNDMRDGHGHYQRGGTHGGARGHSDHHGPH